ncbi:hypothetical protein ACET3Z_031854 [Daucus carota]
MRNTYYISIAIVVTMASVAFSDYPACQKGLHPVASGPHPTCVHMHVLCCSSQAHLAVTVRLLSGWLCILRYILIVGAVRKMVDHQIMEDKQF